jgi:tetratricopeptide (TPR) repeat protein
MSPRPEIPKDPQAPSVAGDRRVGRAAALAAASCAVIAIFAVIACTAVSELGSRTAADDYYNRLADGLANGTLSLDLPVPQGLIDLPDPYDRDANSAFRGSIYEPGRLHDLSYYRGRLYLYFSVVPAITLFLPFHWVTGRYLSHAQACFIFCSLGFIASAVLLLSVRRRCFPGVRLSGEIVGTLCLGLVPMLPNVLESPDVWEVPIFASYAFWMLSLLLLWRVLCQTSGSWVRLTCLGATVGLAIACRPNSLLGALILLVPLLPAFRRGPGEGGIGIRLGALAAMVLPLLAIGAGLAAYNYGRFGDALEFGQKYQLSGNLAHSDYFQLRFFWYDFRMYFLEYPGWEPAFPFVRNAVMPPSPDGYGGIYGTVGILTLLPFTLVAFASPFGLRGTGSAQRPALAGITVAAALLFVAIAAPLCFFFGAVNRYQVEFAPSLVILAVLGLFTLEGGQSRRTPARVCAIALAYACALLSIGYNLLMATSSRAASLAFQGNMAMAHHRWEAAGDLYRRSLRLAPSRLDPLMSLGLTYAQEGRIEEARSELENTVRIHPESADAHATLGWALFKLGRLDEAAGQCREALRLNPQLKSAQAGLRQITAALGAGR